MERDAARPAPRGFRARAGLPALARAARARRRQRTWRGGSRQRLWEWLLLAALAGGADRRTIGQIDRRDPRLDQLVPAGATIEVLADGFKWSEGPVWDRAGGAAPVLGRAEQHRPRLERSRGPLGVPDAERLHGQRAVHAAASRARTASPSTRRATWCSASTATAAWRGARATTSSRSPTASRASASTARTTSSSRRTARSTSRTPPTAGRRPSTIPTARPRWQGVYRVTPDGKVSLLVKDLKAPNGIGLSPDGKTLYVAQSDGDKPYVMAYPVQADGSRGHGSDLLRRDPTKEGRAGRAGRPEGGQGRQRLRDRPRRRPGPDAEGRAPRARSTRAFRRPTAPSAATARPST